MAIRSDYWPDFCTFHFESLFRHGCLYSSLSEPAPRGVGRCPRDVNSLSGNRLATPDKRSVQFGGRVLECCLPESRVPESLRLCGLFLCPPFRSAEGGFLRCASGGKGRGPTSESESRILPAALFRHGGHLEFTGSIVSGIKCFGFLPQVSLANDENPWSSRQHLTSARVRRCFPLWLLPHSDVTVRVWFPPPSALPRLWHLWGAGQSLADSR